MKNGAAMCLPGIGIFVHPKSYFDEDLLRHEYGHVLQAKKFGIIPFYFFIAPISLISAVLRKNHHLNWVEKNANWLSFNYFGAPLDWPMRRFPVK
jgi:hypothetical protein